MKNKIIVLAVTFAAALFFSGQISAANTDIETLEKAKIATTLRYLPMYGDYEIESRITGGWRYGIAADKLYLYFFPRVCLNLRDPGANLDFFNDWEARNWNDRSVLSFDRLYLGQSGKIFDHVFNLGFGVNQFSDVKNFWNLLNDPNNRQPFDMTDLGDVYPLGVPAVWAEMFLGDVNSGWLSLNDLKLKLILSKQTFSKMSRFSNHVFNWGGNPDFNDPNDDFLVNFESVFSGKFKGTEFQFHFFRGYSTTPVNNCAGDDIYSLRAFELWSTGLDLKKQWRQYTFEVNTSYINSGNGVDEYVHVATSVQRVFDIYGLPLNIKISHLLAETIQFGDARYQRVWDPRRGLGNSLSVMAKLGLGMFEPFVNVTDNYEEMSCFFEAGVKAKLSEHWEAKAYLDMYTDKSGSYFDQYEKYGCLGFGLTYTF